MTTKNLDGMLAESANQLRQLKTSNEAFQRLVEQAQASVELGRDVLADNGLTRQSLERCERELRKSTEGLSKVHGQIVAGHLALTEAQDKFLQSASSNLAKVHVELVDNRRVMAEMREALLKVAGENSKDQAQRARALETVSSQVASVHAQVETLEQGLVAVFESTMEASKDNGTWTKILLAAVLVMGAANLWLKF